MFHAFRAAARRAASRSTSSFNAAAATTQSSMAVATVLLVAIISERQNNEDGAKNTVKCQEAKGSYVSNEENSQPFRNFVATSASPAQCEHSSASSFHNGLMPDHDLRLRRAVTSKRMDAEKSRRTFFSSYEVEFDDPLGSGKFFGLYMYNFTSFAHNMSYSPHYPSFQVPTEMSICVENGIPEKHVP